MASFDRVDLIRARAVAERYRDLLLVLTDASLVVLAHRYETESIATLDERHFGVVQSLKGRPFTILPADRSGPSWMPAGFVGGELQGSQRCICLPEPGFL
ncbi:hypothetical protein [Candidatus Poriferisodalis sp.]|uniref:hypothetical protein n=1 Tax=Candidatus Poriferisodalis sp. TaxID=3101277 RepID=UPI003C6EDD26